MNQIEELLPTVLTHCHFLLVKNQSECHCSVTAIQSDGSACTVAPGHNLTKKKLIFQNNFFCFGVAFLVAGYAFAYAGMLVLFNGNLLCRYSHTCWAGHEGFNALCFLHIKITMWKSGLQNLKHSECSLQFYRRSHRTLGNLRFNYLVQYT